MAFGDLNIEGLQLVRDGARLIGPVDLRLESRGITAIMGANGSGKSLFLQLIHGLIAPSSGRVLWDHHAAATTRARRGFVFQTCPVMRRSVAQNVGFPLRAAGIGGAERRTRVALALEAARLSDRADLPAASLSGGERQRMALARALVIEPDVILLDEPAASLDPASTKALEAMVVESAARGVKILIATHDIAQARRLAGDILFFDGGQIVEIAAAKAFFNAPASEAGQNYLKGLL